MANADFILAAHPEAEEDLREFVKSEEFKNFKPVNIDMDKFREALLRQGEEAMAIIKTGKQFEDWSQGMQDSFIICSMANHFMEENGKLKAKLMMFMLKESIGKAFEGDNEKGNSDNS